MKNSYFLFSALVACFIALVFMKPVEVIAAPVADKSVETEVYSITTPDNCPAIIWETSTISFSARTVSISCSQSTKTFERLLKNILSVRKDPKIEFSVENYIFFVESLAYYLDNLTELRRLNI